MRRGFRTALAVTLFAAASIAAAAEAPAAAEATPAGIAWIDDPPTAFARAEETGRPILVDVYADWCQPCRVMDRETWAKESVARSAEGFVALRLDSERYVSLTNRYEASILPTTLVLDPTGRLVTSVPGVVGPRDMRDLLDRVTAGWEAYRTDSVRFDDPDALVRAADYLGDIGNVEGGAAILRTAAGLLRSRNAEPEHLQTVEIKLAQAMLAEGKLTEAQVEFERLASDGATAPIRALSIAGSAEVYRRRGQAFQADRALERLRAEYPDLARELGY